VLAVDRRQPDGVLRAGLPVHVDGRGGAARDQLVALGAVHGGDDERARLARVVRGVPGRPADGVRMTAATGFGLQDAIAALAVLDLAAHEAQADSATRFGPRRPDDRHGRYYFYQGLPYGSSRLTNPLRMILNGGYGIMQVGGRDNHVLTTDYENGWRNLWKN